MELFSRVKGAGEWDDVTTRRWMDRLRDRLRAESDQGQEFGESQSRLIAPSLDKEVIAHVEDVNQWHLQPTVSSDQVGNDAVEGIPTEDSGRAFQAHLQNEESDEGLVEARLQTLADETTGITDVSIASFASDVSDASAFRPIHQG